MFARVFTRSRLDCGSLCAEAHAGRSVLAFLRRTSAGFAAERSGTVAVLFALMTIVLCLFAGAAIDLGRWLHARQQTISAMDAAVLAGGRELQLDSTNVSGAIAAAQAYYAENTKGRMKLLSDTISFTPTDNNTAFTATGNAYIATPLLGFINIPKMALLNTAGAEYSKAELQNGGNGGSSVEISLMLDVTGSMCNSAYAQPCSSGTKLDAMKAAAQDLVEIVVAADQSKFSSKVAVIPFSEGVRLPSSANSAARGSPSSSVSVTCPSYGYGGSRNTTCTYYRSPCVVERKGTYKYTDTAPGSNKYVMTEFTDDGNCALSSSSELIPLSTNKSTLKTKIGNLVAQGGTAGQVGTAWAWYTLSPNWNALWSSASDAASYGTTNLQKIAILMTDGEYNTQYDSKGISTSSPGAGSAANDSSTNQARELCTAMKDKGIIVYTVGFDLGGNQTAIDTLSGCATDPGKYYNAANGDELKQAFRDIALKISDLYLTK